MVSFVESKFEETFTEEQKVIRSPNVQDTHIHLAFLMLGACFQSAAQTPWLTGADPLRVDKNIATGTKLQPNSNGNGNRIVGGLDEYLDLQVLRVLQGKTTVIPVISKADTVTAAHMKYLKRTVWDSMRQAGLDPLESLGLDDEPESPVDARLDEVEEESDGSGESLVTGARNPASTSPNSKRLSNGSSRRRKNAEESAETPYLPLSIISPDMYEPDVIGRKFPWGFADPMNEEHCDFVRLKDAVFNEWRTELRETSRQVWYEGWRASILGHREENPKRR